MSKEQQQQHHHYQTRGAQKRSSNAEQQQQKRERDGQQQMFEQQIQQNLLMKSSIGGGGGVASESEENSGGSNNSSSTGHQQQQQQLLQKQNSLLSNNSNHSTSQFSMYSGAARMDDEDPIFTLDEEVHAKSVERTRHFTADFDPTVSDDDDFQKDLHGGRAYSVSTRFPPRIRHSGRSGHPHQNTTGIFHNHHKLHGQHGGGVDSLGPAAPIIPASLPIQISRGFNWPPRELVGSLSEEEEISIGGGGAGEKCAGGMKPLERARARTTINPFSAGDIETGAEAIIGQQQNGGHHHHQQQNGSEREEQIGDEEVEDLYGRMQAYSRSIQPEDDPERIFGERPHRRYSISFKHVHPGAVDVDGVGNAAIGGGDLLETSEETGIMVGDPHGEDSIGGENIPPGLLANNPTTIIPAAANPTTVMTSQMVGPTAIGGGNPAAGGANGGGGTPRIIVPASLRG